MARYAIGDIQGCYTSFMQLIDKINFNPSSDVLYLVGDLVNRGPDSLKVLKWVYKHQDSIITVLGNHDIYLLARYNHQLKADDNETIKDILRDDSAGKLIDWLRRCPLIYHDADYILVHAGIYPNMDFNQLLKLNHTITNYLQSREYPAFLASVYGNKPNYWSPTHSLTYQMKFVINSCTRMRYLNTADLSLDYKYKGELANQPIDLIPWFKTEFHPTIKKKILFGHWASLGFYHSEKFVALDTGCVWGRKLTAFNLENFEIAQIDYTHTHKHSGLTHHAKTS